ncbi:unnamed protein product [Ectocarpus sp. 4 AP-2014]
MSAAVENVTPQASSSDNGSDSDGFVVVSDGDDFVKLESPPRPSTAAVAAPAAAPSAGPDERGPTVGIGGDGGGGAGAATHHRNYQPATSSRRPTASPGELVSSINRSHAVAAVSSAAAAATSANVISPYLPLRPNHPCHHHHHHQNSPPWTRVAAVPPEAPRLPSHYVERSALLEKVVNMLIATKHLDNGHASGGTTTNSGDNQLDNNFPIRNNGNNGTHVEKCCKTFFPRDTKNTSGDGHGNENSNDDDGREGAAYALLGDSGSGKTVLASAIVSHPEVRKKFWRGIFWVNLGRGGVVTRARTGTRGGLLRALLHDLAAQVVAVDHPLPANGEEAAAATALLARSASAGETLKQLASSKGDSHMGELSRLLVLDGISESFTDNPNAVAELERAGFTVLVTCSRPCALSVLQSKQPMAKSEVGVPGGIPNDLEHGLRTSPHRRIHVSVLHPATPNEAVEMLLKRVWRPGGATTTVQVTSPAGWAEQKAADAGDPGANASTRALFESCALQVVNHCGEIAPLALAIVGAVIAGQDETGCRRDNSPPCDYAERCRQIERQIARHQACGDGYDAFSKVMEMGFDALPGDKTKDCLVRLGVLAEGTVAPLDMLSNLWEQDSEETARTVNELLEKSFLIEMDSGSRCYSIHDRALAFAKTKLLRAGFGPDGFRCRCHLGGEKAAASTTARSTREAAVVNQVDYLSRPGILSRFSYSGGGSNGVIGDGGDAGTARGCGGDGMLLGGLPALAALWQSLEDLRSDDGCYCERFRIVTGRRQSPRRRFLRDAYGASLQRMGVCVEAAFGYWAAAKLLQLQGINKDAKTMAGKSVHVGNALYHAGAVQAERLPSKSTLLRNKGKDNKLVDRYEKEMESVRLSYGYRHPAVASALSSLAHVLLEQGKTIPAGVRYREALVALEGSLGDDHPLVANALMDVVKADTNQLMSLPDGEERRLLLSTHGSELCSRALSIYDDDLGLAVIMLLRENTTSLVRLAHMLEEQGNVKEGKQLCRAALHTLDGENPLGRPQVAAVLATLAGLLDKEVHGFTLRDAFACPITGELMRDPVVAGDGHTYEREAIEMWLRKYEISPKTSEPIEHLLLVPNLNLRRLIRDFLIEGGEELYVGGRDSGVDDEDDGSGEADRDKGDGGEIRREERPGTGEHRECRFALVTEQILVLKCLGSVYPAWNIESFRVTERGCVGGRNQPDTLAGADFMQISDASVSKRHFGIAFDKEDKLFSLRDLGSAGGTFVRLESGVSTLLYPGMIILLGRHQLEVIDVSSTNAEAKAVEGDRIPFAVGDKGSNATSPSNPSASGDSSSTAARRRGMACSIVGGSAAIVNKGSTTDGGERELGHPIRAQPAKSSSSKQHEEGEGGISDDEKELEAGVKLGRGNPRVCLECFAPGGTPIQASKHGKRFFVGREGATLGVKNTNTIAFSYESDGNVIGIDDFISGVHAMIVYDEGSGFFYITDGSSFKSSKNGTWVRLSGKHTESRPYPLSHGTEILIGTVPFSVTLETMAVEKELTAVSRGYVVRDQDHQSSHPWGANPDGNRHDRRGEMAVS